MQQKKFFGIISVGLDVTVKLLVRFLHSSHKKEEESKAIPVIGCGGL
jgi:hypothetical protein